MGLMIPKIAFFVTGLGGLSYGISKALIKKPYKPKGPYVVVKLGEYGKVHELTMTGKEIFTKAGQWMEYKDFSSVSIDGKILDGEYMFANFDEQFCLKNQESDSKWCWDRSSSRTDQYAGGWKLKDLLYKFNFEDVNYFPEDNWNLLGYKLHINKIGEQGCSLQARERCVAGNKELDLKRGELV